MYENKEENGKGQEKVAEKIEWEEKMIGNVYEGREG